MEYSINTADRDGQTKLHVACALGNLTEVFQLVNRGADINLTDKAGWTPMHCAGHSKAKEVFKFLLEREDADVHMTTDSGATALHYFCRYFDGKTYQEEEDHTVERLIQKGRSSLSSDLNRTQEVASTKPRATGRLLCTMPVGPEI